MDRRKRRLPQGSVQRRYQIGFGVFWIVLGVVRVVLVLAGEPLPGWQVGLAVAEILLGAVMAVGSYLAPVRSDPPRESTLPRKSARPQKSTPPRE